MYPQIGLFGLSFDSFQVMVLAAIIAGFGTGAMQARHAGLSVGVVIDLLPWACLAGLLGSKLYAALLTGADLTSWSAVKASGNVWYGALIGGTAAAVWRYTRDGRPASTFFDQGVACIALGHAVGRIGCFLVGDDYGWRTTLPWGVAFPNGAPPTTAGTLRSLGDDIPATITNETIVAVHPVQLYEAAGNVLLFALLWRASHQTYRPWQLTAAWLMAAGTQRFLLEFLRPKTDRLASGLTVTQLIALGFVAAGAALWVRSRPTTPSTIQQQLANT